MHDFLCSLLGTQLDGVDRDFRIRWRLIGAVNASEILQLTGPGLLLEPLHIASLRFFQRRVDKDFYEFAIFKHASHHRAFGGEGRDE